MGNGHRGLDSCHFHPSQSLPCPWGEELEITGPGVLYLRAIRLEQKLGGFQSLYPRILRSFGFPPPPPRAKTTVLQILSATNYKTGKANVRGCSRQAWAGYRLQGQYSECQSEKFPDS